MARKANVYVQVDSSIKEQADNVLNQLEISISKAMAIYLHQIALQRKIPFEMKLPEVEKPISLSSLSSDEFDTLMNQALKAYKDGLCSDINDFKDELKNK